MMACSGNLGSAVPAHGVLYFSPCTSSTSAKHTPSSGPLFWLFPWQGVSFPPESAGSTPPRLCGAHFNTLFKNTPPAPQAHSIMPDLLTLFFSPQNNFTHSNSLSCNLFVLFIISQTAGHVDPSSLTRIRTHAPCSGSSEFLFMICLRFCCVSSRRTRALFCSQTSAATSGT